MFGDLFQKKNSQDPKNPQQQNPQQPPAWGQPMMPQNPNMMPGPGMYPQRPPIQPGQPMQPMMPPTQQPPGAIVGSKIDPSLRQDMSALSHLDSRATQVLSHAQQEAKRVRQAVIEPDLILLGLLYDQAVFELLDKFNVDAAKLQSEIQQKQTPGTFLGQPTLSTASKQIFDDAYKNSKTRGASFVTPEDILMAVFANTATANALEAQGLKKQDVEEKLAKNPEFATGRKSVLDKFGVDLTQEAAEGRLDPVTGREKEVERLVHILLRRTKNNPIIIGEAGVGKTAIIEGLAQSIVSGQVPKDLQGKHIIQLDMSSMVAGASHRGEFEERLRSVMKEAMSSSGQIILFVDEIHTLMGAGGDGGAMDASNIIKPHLARGHLQIIGTTTTSEYRKYFEKDKAFERRFQPIVAEEPSEEVAIEMLKVLRAKYEAYHHVTITDEALEAAVKLSKKYIGERYLPDKAVDLLDEAASEVKLRLAGVKTTADKEREQGEEKKASEENPKDEKKEAQNTSEQAKTADPSDPVKQQLINAVEGGDPKQADTHAETQQQEAASSQDPKHDDQSHAKAAPADAKDNGTRLGKVVKTDIENVVSSWTGIPITKLTEDEGKKLLQLEDRIHQRFIDQEEAVKAVAEAVRRGRIGLAAANRPIASFIFLGPTGVGKTELAKTVAEILFGRDDAMIRLDMSEYMEKHEVAKLIGAPPGYVGYEEGGQLTEAVRAKPYSIVLFDEVEKAHPDVFNILLQLLEDGRLTDNKGNTIFFKNTIIICTSNIGSQVIQQKLLNTDTRTTKTKEEEEKAFGELQGLVNEELRKFFRPELLNRFDDIVIFKPLRQQDMDYIARLGIKKTAKLLKDQGYTLDITDNAVAQLAKDGYDPVYGARPLRRLIQMQVENPIAMELISRKFTQGDTILIDFDQTQNIFVFNKGQAKVATADVQDKAGMSGKDQPAPQDQTQPGLTPQQGQPADPTQVPQGDPNNPNWQMPPGGAGMVMQPPMPGSIDPYAAPQQGYDMNAQQPQAMGPYGQPIQGAYDPNQMAQMPPAPFPQDPSNMAPFPQDPAGAAMNMPNPNLGYQGNAQAYSGGNYAGVAAYNQPITQQPTPATSTYTPELNEVK
jgi:ATP-dependent Clp protease ATP-binding subunit ClpC